MNVLKKILNRINQILIYTSLSSNWLDKYNLAILGITKGPGKSTIAKNITKIGKIFYPNLIVRLNYFGRLKLILNPHDRNHMVILDEFLFEDVYDLSYIKFSPELIIDCGAHIGLFTALVAHHFQSSTISSFEPDPRNFRFLHKMIKLNSLENVECYDAAVSNYEGSSEFLLNSQNYGSYLLNKDDELEKNQNEKEVVSVIDLPRLLLNKKPNSLLLKIDIEGGEMDLIPDLIPVLPNSCVIYFEWHHGSEMRKKIFDALITDGFEIRVLREVGNKYSDNVAIRL